MKNLRNFYITLVGVFSILSGIIIGILWSFYEYPYFNYMVSYHNKISIFNLNNILVAIGIFTIAASLYYYREATKKEKDSDVGFSAIERHTKGN